MAFSRSWIPFREMGELRRNIDDMLEHLRGRIGYPLGSGSTAVKPPMESFVEGGKLIVRAELPGIDPKEITVNVVGDMLMIRASRQEEHETKKRLSSSRVQIRCPRTLYDPSPGREGRGHQGKLQQWPAPEWPAPADHPNS